MCRGAALLEVSSAQMSECSLRLLADLEFPQAVVQAFMLTSPGSLLCVALNPALQGMSAPSLKKKKNKTRISDTRGCLVHVGSPAVAVCYPSTPVRLSVYSDQSEIVIEDRND